LGDAAGGARADAFSMRRVLLSAVAVGAVCVAAAGAAPNLVSPAGGASMTTTHPAFSWAVPSGENVLSISVARSPKINPSTDDFMPGEISEVGWLKFDQTTWTPTRPLAAGRYFWHVGSRTDTGARTYSEVSSFVIRPQITKLAIAAKSGYGRMFVITTSWVANERKVDFVARLFQGSKRLG
jgi:hypothetical protein